MKATLSGGGERTIMKLVVDAASDRVVGAHILGHEAGEMIQVLAIAVKMGATQGRSRRDDGGPSDRRGGTGDDAHARRPDRTRKERRRSPVGGGAKPWLARLPRGALDDLAHLDEFGAGQIHEGAHARGMAQVGVGEDPQIDVEFGLMGAPMRASRRRWSPMKHGRIAAPTPPPSLPPSPSTELTRQT